MKDDDLILIPRRVIGAACGALGRSDKKDCAALVDLRSYAFHPASPPHVADALDGEREWRVGWACSYSGVNLYSDDGELQDNSVQPFIDWLHDSAADISRKIEVRSQKQAAIAARAEAGDRT
jgi:hypothetical protein